MHTPTNSGQAAALEEMAPFRTSFLIMSACYLGFLGLCSGDPHVSQLFHLCSNSTSNSSTSSNSSSNFPPTFSSSLAGLLSSLVSDAPARGFSALEAPPDDATPDVYGLAQCRSDLSVQDCAACLSSCGVSILQVCPLALSAYLQLDGCFIRYNNTPFFDRDDSVWTSSSGTSNKLAIILSTLGAAVLIFLACVASACILKRRRTKEEKEKKEKKEDDNERPEELEISIVSGTLAFSYQALSSATKNFAHENLLGKGGFGEVYKGVLDDSTEIAVKKLVGRTNQPIQEFLTEVKLSGCVQHRNLVKLLGCCTEKNNRILVYEYMQNRSLHDFVFGPQRGALLDWPARRNIIIGVARGLTYLHEESQVRIIHRDIKLSNILLDANLVPKIGDFGLAEHFDKDHRDTKVAGTIGYIPPECAMNARLTEKVDVFGFGILVLEVISGRRNKDRTQSKENQHLLEWVRRLCAEGKLEEVVDKRVVEEAGCSLSDKDKEEILAFLEVGLLCTEDEAEVRPQMSRILLMLCGASEFLSVHKDQQLLRYSVRENATPASASSSMSMQDRMRRFAFNQDQSSSSLVLDSTRAAEDASKNLVTVSLLDPR